jgi:hypothetical protein
MGEVMAGVLAAKLGVPETALIEAECPRRKLFEPARQVLSSAMKQDLERLENAR